MTNGPFSITGGFWELPQAVQLLGAPTLKIVPAAGPGNASISWTPNTPGFVLQETLSLSPTNWFDSVFFRGSAGLDCWTGAWIHSRSVLRIHHLVDARLRTEWTIFLNLDRP